MGKQYGPWVRLWGVHRSQLPLESSSPQDLKPLLTSILVEGRSFIEDVPSSDSSSTQTSSWKSKGIKHFDHSAAPVYLYERSVSAADLQAVARQHQQPHVDGTKVRSENWILRRSVHEDAAATGTASWEEWVKTFKDNHAKTEKEFTPTVLSTSLLQTWDCSGLDIEVDGESWVNWTLKLEESVHKMPSPLKSRVFPVLQTTCSAQDRREVMVIQIALRDSEAEAEEKETVWGAYTSVERLRETEGGVEWVMGTVSDARGVLPAWLQRMTVPGFIAKDVDMFLGWISTERKGKRRADVDDDSEGQDNIGGLNLDYLFVMLGGRKDFSMTISRHLSVPSTTPPATQRDSLASQASAMAPNPSQSTQGSSYTSQLHVQADALARMTFELNIRAVGAQADRLERDLKQLIACTAENKDFQTKHEERLSKMWQEILAVKTRMAEVGDTQEHCKVDQKSCQVQMDRVFKQFESETTDLRLLVESAMTQIDQLQASKRTLPNAITPDNTQRSGVETRAMAKAKAETKTTGKARNSAVAKGRGVEVTTQSAEAIRKRIRETIGSTRRWNRDHKTTLLDDGSFVANYLKQQSKRDSPMAVFIQKNIRRRIRHRLPRGAAPPDTLEAFCRNVSWKDVIETVEIILVKNESAAIQALRQGASTAGATSRTGAFMPPTMAG
ncbi:hypothetical protein HJFPF1_01023 [Paramyrothecium foliicola]|nr:hypothetical protein HJFPF1_01023 [Paramyrothecium foliicola]